MAVWQFRRKANNNSVQVFCETTTMAMPLVVKHTVSVCVLFVGNPQWQFLPFVRNPQWQSARFAENQQWQLPPLSKHAMSVCSSLSKTNNGSLPLSSETSNDSVRFLSKTNRGNVLVGWRDSWLRGLGWDHVPHGEPGAAKGQPSRCRSGRRTQFASRLRPGVP